MHGIDFQEEKPPVVDIKGPMAQSALIHMPKERVEQMTAKARARIPEIRNEMGWARNLDSSSGWTKKRHRYWQQYRDEWDFRKTDADWQGIYEHSNESLNDVKRGVQHVLAKMHADFFGAEPSMDFIAEGEEDDELRERLTKRCQWQSRRMRVKGQCKEQLRHALVQGEGVCKLRYHTNRCKFQRWANVLVYGTDSSTPGATVMAGGRPILEADWIPHPRSIEIRAEHESKMESDDEGAGEMAEETAAEPPPAVQVSKRDYTIGKEGDQLLAVSVDEGGNVVAEPVGSVTYQRQLVEVDEVFDKGARVDVLPLGSYGFPLTASSVAEADCFFHTYELSLSDIAKRYQRPDLLEPKRMADVFKESLSGESESVWQWLTRKIAEFMRNAKSESGKSMDEDAGSAGGSTLGANSVRIGHLCDMVIKFDADGDGYDEDVLLTLLLSDIDATEAVPLYWDYVGAVFPKAERPFYVNRVIPAENVMYGVGLFEWYQEKQKSIEKAHNIIAFRNSASGNLKILRRDKLKNCPNDLEVGATKIYEPKGDDVLLDNIFVSIPLFETSEGYEQRMETIRQALQLEMGVNSEAQGQALGMPSSDTATGAELNAQSSNLLTDELESEMQTGMEDMLSGWVRLDLEYMDEFEDYTFMEGKQRRVGRLTRAEIDGLELNVQLKLTKKRNRIMAANSDQAINISERWLTFVQNAKAMGVPDEDLRNVRELFIERLKAYDIADAEDKLVDPAAIVPPPMPAAGGGAPAGAPGTDPLAQEQGVAV